jgi:hypothetical protein
MRAALDRLVRSHDDAGRPRQVLHRLRRPDTGQSGEPTAVVGVLAVPGDFQLLGPTAVIEKHDATPIAKHGLMPCRHRHAASVRIAIILIGDIDDRQQARDHSHALILSGRPLVPVHR